MNWCIVNMLWTICKMLEPAMLMEQSFPEPQTILDPGSIQLVNVNRCLLVGCDGSVCDHVVSPQPLCSNGLFFFFGQHLFFNTGIHPTEKNKKAWSEQGGIKGHKIIRKEKKHSLIQNGRDTRGYRRLESSDNS